MINSRAKGARAEREAAQVWASLFQCEARRGQQFAGGKESPDVIHSIDGIHLEVKRVEKGNPYVWMEQAIRDAGPNLPVVLHRRNGKDWLAIVRLSDVPRLAREVGAQDAQLGGRAVSGDVSDTGVPATTGKDARPPWVL